jgi:glycine/serine hydroxymethyltransferase
MGKIVQLFDEVLVNIENETVITSVGERVVKMMKDYPLFAM